MIQTNLPINQTTWFTERQVTSTNVPVHFVESRIRPTAEMLDWVSERCSGRYGLTGPAYDPKIKFEDPSELMMFELTFG